MTTVIDRIVFDHEHLARLLEYLDHEIAGYREETNYEPQLPIILDALEYLHHYPDAFHHPLESRLVARLRSKMPSRAMRLKLDTIEDQHKDISELTSKLIEGFNTIASDQVISMNKLLSDYSLYSNLLKEHLRLETNYMVPAMKTLLTADDLAIVEDDLKQMSDPLFGAHTWEVYEGLYNYIMEYELEAECA